MIYRVPYISPNYIYSFDDISSVMKKPSWLKKADASKPWKYKHIIQDGKHKGLEIEPYNFNTPIGMDVDKIDEACTWIDSQMEKER